MGSAEFILKLLAGFLSILAISPLGLADNTIRPNLAYSTPFGGSGADVSTAIAADAAGNSYIAGRTNSADFPVVHGFQTHPGGTPLRTSMDAGSNWSVPNLAAGVLSVAASPGAIWAGTNNGLYVSTDSGKTWRPVPSLRLATVSSVVIDATEPNLIFACTQSGIFKSQDAGSTWNLTAPSLPNGSGCSYLVASPSGTSNLFGYLGSQLYRSTDGGSTWANVGMEYPFAIAFNPKVPSTVYALHMGPRGEEFAISTDRGSTWADTTLVPVKGPLLCQFHPQGLAVSGTVLLAAAPSGVVRSADGGNTWDPTSITSPANVVAVDTTNPQVVYANADRVYSSADGGVTWSPVLSPIPNFIDTIGAGLAGPSTVFAGSSPPSDNIFVTKMSPDGKRILYSTYLGGGIFDYPTGIAVDGSGNTYVTGITYSPDFPVTADAFQKKLLAPSNAFLAKISPDGGTLLYATFLGGSTGDAAYAIALDQAGNVYLTGWAGSADFPVTTGIFQSQIRQNCSTSPFNPNSGDVFVAKFSGDGRKLLYSTFLGGTCADLGLGIAVDAGGNAYVAGVTNSPDFPTTKGVVQPTPPAMQFETDYNSGFLAKINPQGSGLVYATYVGGPLADVAQAVAVDSQGNAYVTGSSFGFTQETLGNTSCSASYNLFGYFNGSGNNSFAISSGGAAFLLKLDAQAATTLSLRFLGECYAAGNSIALDPQGRVWFAGVSGTAVSDFSAIEAGGAVGLGTSTVQTLHPFQAAGLGWGFVAQTSPDGGTLLFSSLLDREAGVALDAHGNAYVAGTTTNTELVKQEFVPGYLDSSSLVLGIDTDVSSPLTIEAPQTLAQQYRWAAGAFAPLVIAPGVIGFVTGSGLGPGQTLGPQVSGGQVATSMGGTTLSFNGIAAPLLSVQDQRVEFAVPFELAGLSAVTIQAANNGSLSQAMRVPVTSVAAEILALANQDSTTNSSANPAAQGSVVTVYAAGMGQTAPPGNDGQINGGQINGTDARTFPSPVNVVIDTLPVNGILYAGPAPGQVAGIDQISISLPVLNAGYHLMSVGFGSPSSGTFDTIAFYVAK